MGIWSDFIAKIKRLAPAPAVPAPAVPAPAVPAPVAPPSVAPPPAVGVGAGDVPVRGLGAGLLAGYLLLITGACIGLLLGLWPSLETFCCQPEVIVADEKATDPPAAAFAAPGTQPNLTDIKPRSGPVSGANTIVLRGRGFTPTVFVEFNGLERVQATPQDSGTIRLTAPAHAAGAVSVKVLNQDATVGSNENVRYEYREIRRVQLLSVSPDSGRITGGSKVILRGSGFLENPSVTFGGVEAREVHGSDEVLVVTAPGHPAGPVNVEVRNSDGQSAMLQAAYTFTCPATYEVRLFIAVLLAGMLGATLHAMRSLSWYFGNKTLVRNWTLRYVLLPFTGGLVAAAFYLIMRAGLWKPEKGGTGLLIVGIAILVGMFSEQAVAKLKDITEAILTKPPQGANQAPPIPPAATAVGPTVTSIAPNVGSIDGNTLVLLTGTGFSAGDKVTFDGQAASSHFVSPTNLSAVTPPHPAGRVAVTVTGTGNLSSTLPGAYLYTPVSPASGSKSGGTAVVIKGAGFTGTPTVKFGGDTATSVQVVDPNTLSAVTPPAKSDGIVAVTVTDAIGATLLNVAEGFQYTG